MNCGIFGYRKYDDAIHSILAEVHSSRKTPWLATIITTAFTLVSIILYSGKLSDIASISILGILVEFAFVNLSVISLRLKRPRLHRPFMSPFSVKKLPILLVLGMVITSVTILQFNPHVVSSALVPLTCIIILCLILTKRNIDQAQNQR